MMPDPSAATGQAQNPTGPAAPQSHRGQIKDAASGLPTGATMGDAYRAGKQLGQSWANQSAPTHWGAVEDASTHGTVSNGDGGEELATSAQVDALHGRFDELGSQVSSMASSGAGGQAQGNSNLQGLTPSRMPLRPASVSPLAASAQQRQAANERAAGAQQNLSNTRANFSANFAARQAAGAGGIAPPSTTNAMSAGHAEKSFNGNFGSGFGTAQDTWDVQKWQSR